MDALCPVQLLVVGAGGRGSTYASLAAAQPVPGRIVGVAEPRDHYRRQMADHYQIAACNQFADWREIIDRARIADAVLICTPDATHEEAAIAFAKKGYAILLEKPMAPTADACRRIVTAVKQAGVIFAVCHVLRYTAYTQRLKQLFDDHIIGEVVSIQHLEPVGYWHHAHSFVRGNWRKESESSPMLLAKCCHDLDWLNYLMNGRCIKVQSFGSLMHFRKANQPPGAADRCVDCPSTVESACPYSAVKIYLRDRLRKGDTRWPVDVLTPAPDEETVADALRTGPYGRCVYACDNDVVDTQVVNLLFEDGRTASMTMTAFDCYGGRQTRFFGTHGSIEGNGRLLTVHKFLTDEHDIIDTQAEADSGLLGGHGGGDAGVMRAFLAAVAAKDPTKILSGPEDALAGHLIVFAAEESRRLEIVATV